MSGLAGCYQLDGAPADPPLLERMLARMAHRGPTMHLIEGTRAQIRRQLMQSIDAFFELLEEQ